MKKRLSIIFAAALSLVSVASYAQVEVVPYNLRFPYYYVEGNIDSLHTSSHDGVTCSATIKHALGGCPSNICSSVMVDSLSSSGDLAFGFYPDSTLHVIGVAFVLAWPCNYGYQDYHAALVHCANAWGQRHDLRARLYRPFGNALQLMQSKSIAIDSSIVDTVRYRMYGISQDPNTNELMAWNPSNGNLISFRYYIWEVYFDNEVDVPDSFYVSAMQIDSIQSSVLNPDLLACVEYHTPAHSHFNFPTTTYRSIYDRTSDDAKWDFGEFHGVPLVVPIIRRDCDTCPKVRNIEVFKGSPTQFFMRWDAGTNHLGWQVSYGPAGIAPEDGTLVDCAAHQSPIITVDPDSHYVAYVRARCRFARDVWGDWSDPVSIWLNDPGDGIATAAEPAVTLTPNPAGDRVAIAAEGGVTLVEAFAENGACTYRVESPAATIDVSRWTPGTYILRIHTPQGVATRKLAVAR